MKRIFLFVVLITANKLIAQVNLQTGTPDITFPFYSISDPGNRMSTDVSLVYTGGNGIKVDDPGSWVGTGWNLSFGGFISREVRGEPDDQKLTGTFNVFGLGPSSLPSSSNPTDNNTYMAGLLTKTNAYSNYINGYFPNGYLYSNYSANDNITDGGAYNFTTSCQSQSLLPPFYIADRQIDVFTFNFNGRIGKFLIGKDNTHPILLLNQNDMHLKIDVQFDESQLTNGMRTTISGFTITDENGIQYVFQDKELTEVVKYTTLQIYNRDGTPYSSPSVASTLAHQITYISNQNMYKEVNCINRPNPTASSYKTYYRGYNSPASTQTIYQIHRATRTGQYVCNKWMLTRIINPLSNKSIEFNYTTESLITETNHDVIYSGNINSNGMQNETLDVYINTLSSIIKKPVSINNQFGDKIEFIYGDNRQDLNGDNTLSKINCYKNGTWASDIEFSYGYFFQNIIRSFTDNFSSSEQPYLRLALQQFQKKGQNNSLELPYKFSYYLGTNNYDIIPPKFSICKDHYGYYNPQSIFWGSKWNSSSKTLNTYSFSAPQMPFNGNIYNYDIYCCAASGSFSFANASDVVNKGKAGLIQKIVYPNGGTLSYNYEQNISYAHSDQYGYGWVNNGERVNSVNQSDNINSNNSISSNYSYVLADGQTNSGWGYTAAIYSENKQGRFYTDAINGSATINSAGVVQDFVNFTMANGIKGAAGSEVLTLLNNIITPSNFEDQTTFKPNVDWTVIIVYVFDILYDLFGQSSNPPEYQDLTQTIYYNKAINLNDPLPQMFSRVEVQQVNSNNIAPNGKTVFTFTSPADYPIEQPNDDAIHTMKQRYGYWRYGLLKTKEIYSNNDLANPINKLTNIYSSDVSNYVSSSNYSSLNWQPVKTLTMKYAYPDMNIDNPDPASSIFYFFPNALNRIVANIEIPLIPNNIQSVIYYPFTGKVNLNQSIETTKDNSGNIQTTTTNYNYNANNFLVSKMQTKSTGETVETDYTYTNDYTINSGPIATLKLNNAISAPVSTENYVYPNGGTAKYLLSGIINDYGIAPNGDIKIAKTYQFRSSSPVLNSSLQTFNSNQIVRDQNYYKLVSQANYDNNGMPNQFITEGNSSSATLYDATNAGLVIAKATNTAASDIAYTSFETNDLGGFFIQIDPLYDNYGTALYDNSVSVTGNRAYSMHQSNRGTIKNADGSYSFIGSYSNYLAANINTSKSYILSFYSTQALNVSNSVLIKQESGINGYTHYVYSIPQGSTSISISGTALLDEIRLYPSNSIMTSYAYDVTKGKVAEADPNNHITYYEYDDLSRLKLVRDENKNILKQYDYRNQTYSYATSAWQADGQIRCKPCAANSAYITNMQQHHEIDQNPNSLTYHQDRWVDDNVAGSCVSSPDWQTISTSCQQSGGSNTGYQLLTQQDKNPCSSTYNQQQTVTAYNISVCPLPAQNCSYTMSPGYSIVTGNTNSNGSTATFYIAFYPTSSTMNISIGYAIATIGTGCRPSVSRNLPPYTYGGRSWQMVIYPNGQLYVFLTSGSSVPIGSSGTVYLTGTYSL